MELHESKKKKKVRLQPQQPLPIIFDEDGNIIVFTAHLSALGTCIDEPDDMAAVHSMGFFGKGSLSRSYPAFGRARYGAPPVIRNRQWVRRMKWVEEVKQLSLESFAEGKDDALSEEMAMDYLQNQPTGLCGKEPQPSTSTAKSPEPQEDVPEIIESIEVIGEKTSKSGEFSKRRTLDLHEPSDIEILELPKESPKKVSKPSKIVDEVVLDSTEDEEIYEIPNEELCSKTDKNQSDNLWQSEELDLSSEDENDVEIQGKVLVLPDSDSENEDYFRDIKPRIENDGFPVKETLHLTFEETFFLMFGLGCLRVVDFQGKVLSIKEAWEHFCREDPFFVQKYVIYHYFRSKGWVVKPGLKYGGDFLLYKQGPPFYHASYIVIIDVVDAVNLRRIEAKTMRKMQFKNLIGMERLSEAAAKEILLAQVLWPDSIPRNNYTSAIVNLSQFTVNELLWRRWRFGKEGKASTSTQSDEEDDEDSS
ncbi:tRNA-splicing endonuclease subunit Sen2 isoform X2 [Belonocnema kinseyi]|uniref:tRNA-splicing endonuclease subunit Sen2 isoform X2 n=1 Tax=Belonocnema kinseyi TaxID=2817044 RepID=UPI00143D6E89|nr:tRNA-splicing endonuclease subunit Sen2 isoform X2 [Belonocnema kinseyi]